MSFNRPTNESKGYTLAPNHRMAEHTQLALAGAWCRYLYERTGVPPSRMAEVFFQETGETPGGRPDKYRKWLGQRVFFFDQYGRNPFPETA